jgi:hypothetical protein
VGLATGAAWQIPVSLHKGMLSLLISCWVSTKAFYRKEDNSSNTHYLSLQLWIREATLTCFDGVLHMEPAVLDLRLACHNRRTRSLHHIQQLASSVTLAYH